MTDKEFKDYAFDKMRQGLSESQIARSLGMSLAHFMGRLNGINADKVDPPKTPPIQKKEKKEKQKPVAKEPEPEAETEGTPAEEFNWQE